MADKAISELPVLATPATDDLAVIVDVSATVGSKTSQIELQDLADALHQMVDPDVAIHVPDLPEVASPVNGDHMLIWDLDGTEGDQLGRITLEDLSLLAASIHDALKPPQYAALYISNGSTPQTFPALTWTKFTGYTADGVSGIEVADDAFTVAEGGNYCVGFSCSATGAENTMLRVNIFVNGEMRPELEYWRNRQNATDVGSNSMQGLLELNAGDVVDVRMYPEASAEITVKASQFHIRRTGR